MLEFSARAIALPWPEDNKPYYFSEVALTDGRKAVMIMFPPKTEVRAREFLEQQEVATFVRALESKLETKLAIAPQTRQQQSQALPKLTEQDLSIVELVRASPNGLSTVQVANRLGLSHKNSSLRARLAFLTAMEVLTSSKQHGYRLGPKAPEAPPASRPA